MTYSEPARTATRPGALPAPPSSSFAPDAPGTRGAAAQQLGITVYDSGQDETALFREMGPHWGVTPTVTSAPVGEANIGLAAGNRHISVGHKHRIPHTVLLALREAGVRYISTRSVGYDHIDVDYAERIGLRIGNVAYSPDSVADYTLMLMLMAIRHAKPTIQRSDLHDYRLSNVRGKELRDLTVGVLGTGRIGTAVIERLRGFGGKTLAYDRRPKTSATYVPLDDLLQQSDIVTLHTPLNADTHHLLDRRRIQRLKDGAIVVNTGRGSLLDTDALLTEIESGRLGGAALDVIEGEEGIFYADYRDKPVENKHLLRLQELPNVLVSPHIAYYTDHALRDTVKQSIINCLEFGSEN